MGACEVEVFVLNKTERSQPLRRIAVGEGDIMVDRWSFSSHASRKIKELTMRAAEDPTGASTSVPSNG
jgi:hypothetical protein